MRNRRGIEGVALIVAIGRLRWRQRVQRQTRQGSRADRSSNGRTWTRQTDTGASLACSPFQQWTDKRPGKLIAEGKE